MQGGAQGALFPIAGDYRIVVDVAWPGDATPLFASAEIRLTVTPAVDAAHAEAARRVLTTPETLLALALGGDHMKAGIEAMSGALKNDTLRPHFAYIEATRLATRFFQRMPNLQAAADLIDETTVMSPAEFRRAVQIVKTNAASAGAPAMAKALKARAAKKDVSDEVRALVRDL